MSSKRDRLQLRKAALQLADMNESLCLAIEHLVGAQRGTAEPWPDSNPDQLLERARNARRELQAIRDYVKGIGG